jgi:putative serine protease PepD
MSQSTGPRPDAWQAPWATPGSVLPSDGAAPAGPGLPVAPAQETSASLPRDAGWPGPGQVPPPVPGPGYPPAGFSTTQPLPAAGGPGVPGSGGPGGTGGPGGPGGRRGSGPGWGGVAAVGAGAAVLASLLTAGVMTATGQLVTSSPSVISSAPSTTGTQSAPLVTSSANLPDWVAVASTVEPSVVSVKVNAGRASGEGSGVILDAQGRILTNNHVIDSAANGGEIAVVLSDGRAYPATIVGTDPATDLAVIKLNTVPPGLKPATLGNSSMVKVGDPVMAIGNPLGLSDTVTTGIVSALNRPVTAVGQNRDPFGRGGGEPVVTNAIQTDAPINPGNSGGALVDSGGRVIGITSSIASLSSSLGGPSGSIGLGFAIPIDTAKQIADELISTGKVQHAYLGVGLEDDAVSLDGAQREAAVIQSVSDGTPAAKAGLKRGDAVIGVNGRTINSRDSLIGIIRAIKPGTQITLTIVRDGKRQDVPVTLARRPASFG